ncbi:MAG: 5-oxoprolinase subunit PxpA [Maribacter sp.]|nr:5-oxoprolinase subunit PxpA [Maribacter sp.]
MNQFYIEINCDLGEGLGNEKELMPFISSCNIACGGHAGDKETMRTVARLASKKGVKVGAHPSYPDRKNFGRITLAISDKELVQSLRSQMADFMSILNEEHIPLHHIKAHGALYNDVAKDQYLAKIFLKAIGKRKDSIFLYVPFDSVIEKEALRQGFQIKREAFGDRNYNADLSLVSRKLSNALIQIPKKVLEQILGIVREEQVKTVTGHKVAIKADTYCIHGDTPSALKILRYLSDKLGKEHIAIKY